MRKEIHARDLVKGKGHIAPTIISRHQRCRMFEGLLKLVASLPNVMLFNVCLDIKDHSDVQLDAWDRLLNRIERTLLELENKEVLFRKKIVAEIDGKISSNLQKAATDRINAYKPRAIIIADEGNERSITKTFRKMNVFNPVPSQLGMWSGGQRAKNIPLERMIEDPFFRRSDQSYFIQLADCVAYALLKREAPPTPNAKKYGLDKMFEQHLGSVCFKPASPKDSLGIVRK
jgi:hypothetical protein